MQWQENTFVAFDIETTGAGPIGSEICEIAGVKWKSGNIIDTFQQLIKPKSLMSDFIIGIHGITNEMVQDAPPIAEVIGQFYNFIKDAIGVAHHAPFDMGFLSVDFENAGLKLSDLKDCVCTSLLSRKVIKESPNHKLQTLVPFLGIESRTAHRALADAEACWDVAKICFERVNGHLSGSSGRSTLDEIYKAQGGPISWRRFSLKDLVQDDRYRDIAFAIRNDGWVKIQYGKENSKDAQEKEWKQRRVKPQSIVRSLDGDFMFAFCPEERKRKRYSLNRIRSVLVLD